MEIKGSSIEKYEEYAAIISALPDLLFVLTMSGRYVEVLGQPDSSIYLEAKSLKGKTLASVLPAQICQHFLEIIQQTLENDKLTVFEYSLGDDDLNYDRLTSSQPSARQRFEGRIAPIHSARYGEPAVVWVARNITERYELEQKLKYQSEIDHLSGSLNRRKLFSHLKDAFYTFGRYEQNSSFLLLDIDNFKRVNDTFGHQCGDNSIRKVAELCQSELRQTDILGRFGGDEFGIIHKSDDTQSAIALARRLNRIVCAATNETYPELSLSISIGISHFKADDRNIDDIYKRADEALYRSKRNGRNTYSSA
ncbi:sensor domain-containing diguanylate cyclase [Ferrimonas lipolytica]|uniref:diguanylate cyclase n=1 Tax=Ferrimonas lipolytica TaxID=2724191 RepID=A0A6H1UFD1_9GAMM|nr:sensor domain-containing diguanylate cyclase [Ferrimonas lipolytica]QIZ76502.1 GGDEF domain-containing protein [Ferrimonas lipolytica]